MASIEVKFKPDGAEEGEETMASIEVKFKPDGAEVGGVCEVKQNGFLVHTTRPYVDEKSAQKDVAFWKLRNGIVTE